MSESSTSKAEQRKRIRGWLKFSLRWGIAVVGIWYVLSNLSLHDRVMILGPDNVPVEARVVGTAPERFEQGTQITVIDPPTGDRVTKTRHDLVNKPDQKSVVLREGNQRVPLLGLDLSDDRDTRVRRLLISDPETGAGRWVTPRQVRDFELHVPHPIVDRGVVPMVRNADGRFLWAAVFIFPVVYLITSWRWYAMLRALSIRITLARALKLNMVGAFYNTFMPGSTGGDLLKAYYIAKVTKLRTRAVMSVIVDRILGLLALVILGGVMATYQYFSLPPDDPARIWCARVSFGSVMIVIATCLALLVFYNPMLRRFSGLDFIIKRLPMQTQVNKAVETMEIYRRRPWLVLWALIITFPVHGTVVVSATFAGMAFGLPLHPLYYWVAVPVIVLSGAIPISPQGAGVMEFFAILLTRRQGATVSQAFALTMSIRLVQILWNLTGGIFVLRGGYHAPSEEEQKELQTDLPDARGFSPVEDGKPDAPETVQSR
jgi:glycosyltransferase 2 family protein